ncbi:trypsin-like peptidase domain-containing protein [Actinokineospora sp. NPDC004072]
MTVPGSEDWLLARMVRLQGARFGSGFVIGPRCVLTAAHIVGPVGSAVVVTDSAGVEHDGVVVWRHQTADNKVDAVDAAAVACREPFVDDFVQWGKVQGIAEVECVGFGYPRAGEQNRRRELVSFKFTLMPMSGGAIHFTLGNARSTWPAEGEDGWPGMSGGPVLTEDGVLIGVLRGVPLKWEGALRAVRMTAVVNDSVFALTHGTGLAEPVPVSGVPAPAAAAAALPAVYEVDPLPGDWEPELTPLRLDPAGRCRLDTLIATSSRGFTAVLADSAAGAARRRGTAAALDGLGGRRWTTVPQLDVGDPGSRQALRQLVGGDWQPDGRTGVVVPLVRTAVGGIGAATVGTARRSVQTLRSLLPDAVVLVRSIGPTPYDAARTAADLGAQLGCRAFLLRPHDPDDPDPVADGGDPLATLAALARDGLVKRGLAWEVPEVPGEVGESAPSSASVAEALSRSRMGDTAVRALLRTAWVSMPDTVAAALPRLAATAHGPTALRVAVDCGLDFAAWLPRVRGVPSPGLPNTRLAAAVVPVLLRSAASRAVVQPWLDHGGQVMRLLGKLLTRDDQAWRFAVGRTSVVGDDAAQAVAAAAVAAGVHPAEVEPGEPLFWALLARTPYGAPLTGLVDGLDPHHRAVVACDDDLDLDLRTLVAGLRAQLPHLPNRR